MPDREQGILKSDRVKMGVQPSMALDQSAEAIQDLDALRLRNKAVGHAKLLDEGVVKQKEEYEELLYKKVLRFPAERMCDEYRAKNYYVCRRIDSTTFYVMRKEYKQYSSDHANRADFIKYMRPQFAWVRVVKIQKFQGQFYLVCSCGLYSRYGWGCRHCHKVRDVPPAPEDCIVRHRIDYLRYNAKPGYEQLTKLFRECQENEPPGIPLCRDPDFCDIGAGDADENLVQSRAGYLLQPPQTHAEKAK